MRNLGIVFLAGSVTLGAGAAEPDGLLSPARATGLSAASSLKETPPCPATGDPGCDNLQLLLGYRTWVSFGRSRTSMAGTGGYPDILSELTWQKLFNPVQEVNLETVWWNRFLIAVDLGIGTSGSGEFRDQDFNGNGRTDLASDTQHSASNKLFQVAVDLGYRFWEFRCPEWSFHADLVVGYQFWEEKYMARGGVSLYPDSYVFPPGDIISNHFRWDSFRLGCRSAWQLPPSWILAGNLMFVPTNRFQNTDVHFLRTDVLQDPSFFDQATGGFGVQFDVTASYRVWEGLFLEAGYRLWAMETGLGLSTARLPEGDLISPLHRASTLRQGLLLGMQYRF